MAVIEPVGLEEALRRGHKGPSARTLRTRRLEEDARQVVDAINARGAAVVDVSGEEIPAERYISGLRSALSRQGHSDILTQKRRGTAVLVAWRMRDEDRSRVEKRKETGRRLVRSRSSEQEAAAEGRDGS